MFANAIISQKPCQMCWGDSKGRIRTLLMLIGPDHDIYACPICDYRK